ncbi:MAG: acyl-protein synthetase [Polyangiales bacterium]
MTLRARILSLIERLAGGARDDAARDALLWELFEHQRANVPPYARYVKQRLHALNDLGDIPALPTDAFRFARIASRPLEEDVLVFRSSGTTQDARSSHALQDLSLYDAAAQAAARHALFPDRERMALLILAPHERELPDSSLSYMLSRFVEWFGDDGSSHVWPMQGPELERLRARLQHAVEAGMPVALLGTSFAFVHALDALQEQFALPAGSRIMQTGGFKGRSREVAADEMRTLLRTTFGVERIVSEYGMTELSSQLYAEGEHLWSPGWTRVSVVHPETLQPLPHGETGLVRIDDLANIDSVAFLQTADLGVLEAGGLRLLGRAPAAVARGCSITADELLGGG